MGPFLSVIVAAMLATIAIDAPPPRGDIDRTTPTVLAGAVIVVAWVTSRASRPASGTALRLPPWARPFDVAAYATLLFATDWVTVCREATGDLPLLRHVLLLSPYVLAALARIDAAWPVEDRERGWTKGRALSFHARLLLIPIAPLLLIHALHDLLTSIPGVRLVLDAYPALDFAAIAALFTVLMVVMPRVLAWIVRARRLDSPDLRGALDADLARQGVRLGGVDHVDTGNLIPNAAYLGLATRIGRVFITDALLAALPPDEVRAVFAHEVAHGTRRHLVWFLILFVTLMFFSYAFLALLGDGGWFVTPLLVVLTIVGGIAFVAISRRFEVEADLVAAETLGDPELFNRALLRVGAMSGRPLDRHGLRHYAIATRTAIVRACAADPDHDAEWRGRIRRAKLGILGFAIVTFGAVAFLAPGDFAVSRARHQWLVAANAREPSNPDAVPPGDPRVRELLRSSIAGARAALDRPTWRGAATMIGVAASMSLADDALAAGDFDEARRIAADVDRNWPVGDPVGDFNRRMLDLELRAIDPATDLGGLHDAVGSLREDLLRLLEVMPPNASSDLVIEELRFLAAATGGAAMDFDPDTFESARVLALARGAVAESREVRRALDALPNDFAWRRVVLERALGRTPAEAIRLLEAATTRRGT